MNSSVAFWPSAAFADVCAVRTTIPSCAVIVQPACSFGTPSSSTRHMRHAPTARRAAARSRRPGSRSRPRGRPRRGPVPFGTCTALPSIVTCTSRAAQACSSVPAAWRCWSIGAATPSIEDSPPNGQPPCSTCSCELVAVLPRVARHGIDGEVAERAEDLPSIRSQTSSSRSRSSWSAPRPRSSPAAARASACPRGTACTCRTTRACRTSPPGARAAPCSNGRRRRSPPPTRRTSPPPAIES